MANNGETDLEHARALEQAVVQLNKAIRAAAETGLNVKVAAIDVQPRDKWDCDGRIGAHTVVAVDACRPVLLAGAMTNEARG